MFRQISTVVVVVLVAAGSVAIAAAEEPKAEGKTKAPSTELVIDQGTGSGKYPASPAPLFYEPPGRTGSIGADGDSGLVGPITLDPSAATTLPISTAAAEPQPTTKQITNSIGTKFR